MKPKTVIITLLASFALIGFLIWGYSQNAASPAAVQGITSGETASALRASETFYDFGMISMKNGDVNKDFVFTNPTDSNIVIRNIETSCMCTKALLVNPDGSTKGPFGMPGHGGVSALNDTVKSGESRTIRVIYDPNAHGPAGVGAVDRFISVTDASGATLRFEIKANVTP